MKNWRRSCTVCGAVCGSVPTDLVLVGGTATLSLAFAATADPLSWLFSVIECGNPSNVLISSAFPGIDRGLDVLAVPAGNWAIRIRDEQSEEGCWVTSNCAVITG